MKCNKRIIPKIIFYTIFVGMSVTYYLIITKGLYNNFIDSKIVFNLDTLFLNWNTSFPAVTICELYNGEKIWNESEKYFGVGHDMRLDDLIGEIVYFRGMCSTCEICENQNLSCPDDFTHLMKRFRTNCTGLVTNCRYQNIVFDCCDQFYPIETEYGTCFAFNSNQARKRYDVVYASNRELGVGSLDFDTTSDIQLYIHSPIEIPNEGAYDMIAETVLLGTNKKIVVNALEVFNHPTLYQIKYDERRCRFQHELTDLGKELKFYELYSFSTCVAECFFIMQLEMCNCSTNFLSKEDSFFKICDYKGLLCLTYTYYDVMRGRTECDCMSSCDEPEYTIIYNSADKIKNRSNISKISVSLAELPDMRYVRRVNKTNLELMISIGELVGLFFNASMIRVVQLVYLVLSHNWKSVMKVQILRT